MYSPPTAGVIGANRKSGCLKNGIPPPLTGVIAMSLRTLTRTCCIPPACGGLSADPVPGENWLNSIPPAYGGYRFPALRRWWSPRTPPRMRGLLAGSDFAKQVQGVFPPLAGGYRA